MKSSYTCLVVIFAISALLSMNLLLTKVSSSFEPDKILSLPGQPSVKFQQFGGYVTVDVTQKRNLFYYYVEAELNSSSKPLVLWLNGGTGCSSLGGAFLETGPFIRSRGDALIKNDYSWNKAKDNLVFLQNWLAKYAEYKNRDFYITGHSYAGHFVPQLANLILNSSLKLNLKGIAIGNPMLDYDNDFNPRADYLWSHGLISDETFQLLQTTCNYSELSRQTQISITPPCALVRDRMNIEIPKLLDAYDVLHDDHCHHHHIFNQRQMEMNEEKLDVCLGAKVIEYMNRRDVQKALNAHLIGVTTWNFCSRDPNPTVKYNKDDIFNISTLPLLGTLTKMGIRVLIYSGDQDSVVSLLGTRSLINGLAKELNLKTTVPYRFWIVGNEVGGWIQEYGKILSYATIRGASHAAPQTQPLRSLVLLRSFLSGKFPATNQP